MIGVIALALIVNTESAKELEDLITSLPIWLRMKTQVIPLTTFDARMQSVLRLIEELKAQVGEIGISSLGSGR